MHPYIPHLLEDIAAAHQEEKVIDESFPKTFEEEMEEVENWIAGIEPPHNFGYYCGLSSELFPPPEQLSEEDMMVVLKAFCKMMFTYNLGIDLPDTLPVPIAYKMTVNTLNSKTDIPTSGMMHWDFCSGYAPDCEFKEYCPCLEFWNELEKEDTSPKDQSQNSMNEKQPGVD